MYVKRYIEEDGASRWDRAEKQKGQSRPGKLKTYSMVLPLR